MKFFEFKKLMWHGVPIIVARAGWSPERGYEIYVDSKVGNSTGMVMWDELVKGGRKYGLCFGSPHQGRRLEGGMLSTCDYENTKLNALELGLPPAIVNLKGTHDFVGKQALLELAQRGPPQRKVVGIRFNDDNEVNDPLTTCWGVTGSGEDIETSDPRGWVTSIGYSPRLCTTIGVATLENELAQDGSTLIVDTPSGPRIGVVSPMPFPGSYLYIKYVQIFKNLEDCYDQMVHPQKRQSCSRSFIHLLLTVPAPATNAKAWAAL